MIGHLFHVDAQVSTQSYRGHDQERCESKARSKRTANESRRSPRRSSKSWMSARLGSARKRSTKCSLFVLRPGIAGVGGRLSGGLAHWPLERRLARFDQPQAAIEQIALIDLLRARRRRCGAKQCLNYTVVRGSCNPTVKPVDAERNGQTLAIYRRFDVLTGSKRVSTYGPTGIVASRKTKSKVRRGVDAPTTPTSTVDAARRAPRIETVVIVAFERSSPNAEAISEPAGNCRL
jgi:hypothetical protein